MVHEYAPHLKALYEDGNLQNERQDVGRPEKGLPEFLGQSNVLKDYVQKKRNIHRESGYDKSEYPFPEFEGGFHGVNRADSLHEPKSRVYAARQEHDEYESRNAHLLDRIRGRFDG